jgi:hypothetical protein
VLRFNLWACWNEWFVKLPDSPISGTVAFGIQFGSVLVFVIWLLNLYWFYMIVNVTIKRLTTKEYVVEYYNDHKDVKMK